MTRIDKICIYYFFAIYIWYDAIVLEDFISVYFFSGLYFDVRTSFPFWGMAIARVALTAIAIVMFFKGLRFDVFMWAMNVIILVTYLDEVERQYFGGELTVAGNSAPEFSVMYSVFFFSACAGCIYLLLRIRMFNSLPLFHDSNRPF